jgi:hypothetical protein
MRKQYDIGRIDVRPVVVHPIFGMDYDVKQPVQRRPFYGHNRRAAHATIKNPALRRGLRRRFGLAKQGPSFR